MKGALNAFPYAQCIVFATIYFMGDFTGVGFALRESACGDLSGARVLEDQTLLTL